MLTLMPMPMPMPMPMLTLLLLLAMLRRGSVRALTYLPAYLRLRPPARPQRPRRRRAQSTPREDAEEEGRWWGRASPHKSSPRPRSPAAERAKRPLRVRSSLRKTRALSRPLASR
eukprot:scaffold2915_cov282-Prasinococcus_capsulatus_cf.AAC.1